MSSTLVGVNCVCVGVDTLVVAGGPLHCDFDREALFLVLGFDRNDLVMDGLYLFG